MLLFDFQLDNVGGELICWENEISLWTSSERAGSDMALERRKLIHHIGWMGKEEEEEKCLQIPAPTE